MLVAFFRMRGAPKRFWPPKKLEVICQPNVARSELVLFCSVAIRTWYSTSEVHMALIIPLIIFVGLAAIIVWIADWTSGGRRYAALADLNRRLASGEIDQPEYEEKRKSAGKIRRQKRRQKAEAT
jgi:Short C-terminal domain